MKAVTHADNWSLTLGLAFQFFTRAPASEFYVSGHSYATGVGRQCMGTTPKSKSRVDSGATLGIKKEIWTVVAIIV